MSLTARTLSLRWICLCEKQNNFLKTNSLNSILHSQDKEIKETELHILVKEDMGMDYSTSSTRSLAKQIFQISIKSVTNKPRKIVTNNLNIKQV